MDSISYAKSKVFESGEENTNIPTPATQPKFSVQELDKESDNNPSPSLSDVEEFLNDSASHLSHAQGRSSPFDGKHSENSSVWDSAQ